MQETKSFYDASYHSSGFDAQRRYPNEELCRFMGRRLFQIPKGMRKEVRVLEVGCGSGANLWMIAAEGFDTYGVDLSAPGVELCKRMLSEKSLQADCRAADMTATPFPDRHFDVIVDVFSSYCLNEADYSRFTPEVARLLKPGGVFFSYTPSQASDAFQNHAPSKLLDPSTLDGIRRETSPFSGNLYRFRFETLKRLSGGWEAVGFKIEHCETLAKTYRDRSEYFEFLIFEATSAPH